MKDRKSLRKRSPLAISCLPQGADLAGFLLEVIMHNINEICTNCEHSFKEHEPEGDGAFWCPDREDSFFVPSGRVSVPTDFVTAVRKLLHILDTNKIGFPGGEIGNAIAMVRAKLMQYEDDAKVRSMLPKEEE